MEANPAKPTLTEPYRLVALLAFVSGFFWMVQIGRRFLDQGSIHGLFLPGIVIWLLWGVMALGLGSTRFCRVTWLISCLWHGLLSLLCVAMVVALAGLPLLFAPLEIAWVILLAIVSGAVLFAQRSSRTEGKPS